jgi:hypothetical protein
VVRWVVTVGACAALALTGCSGNGGSGFVAQNAPPTTSRPPVEPPPVTAAPSAAVATVRPVKVGASAALVTGVLVTVGKARAVKVTGNGPGQVSGAAVAVPVVVRNASSAPFDLGGLVVNASYGKGAGVPAVPSDAAPSAPLKGSVAPGASAKGSYVFLAPGAALSTLRIDVSASNARHVVTFRS